VLGVDRGTIVISGRPAGNRISIGRPGAEVNELAALRTERPRDVIVRPRNGFPASRALHFGHRQLSKCAERKFERNVAINRARFQVTILGREPDPEHVLVGADFRDGCKRTFNAHLQQRIRAALKHLLE
jgi:hypothetical protein